MARPIREELPERVQKPIRWSREPEMQAFMEKNASLKNSELSKAFKAKFGFYLGRGQVTLWRQMNGRLLNKSHNGGKTTKPIGSEYISKDGYLMYKFKDKPSRPSSRDNWMLKHKWIYIQEYGPVPEDSCIIFADGNIRNFDISNLVAVPQNVLVVLNNPDKGYQYHDAESLKACITHIQYVKSITDKALNEPRACKSCGKQFVPKFNKKDRMRTNLATCEACLKQGLKARFSGNAGVGTCAKCGVEFIKGRPSDKHCINHRRKR